MNILKFTMFHFYHTLALKGCVKELNITVGQGIWYDIFLIQSTKCYG